jgi:hypothetical protein
VHTHGKAIEAASADALASPETGLEAVGLQRTQTTKLKALRRATDGCRARNIAATASADATLAINRG